MPELIQIAARQNGYSVLLCLLKPYEMAPPLPSGFATWDGERLGLSPEDISSSSGFECYFRIGDQVRMIFLEKPQIGEPVRLLN